MKTDKKYNLETRLLVAATVLVRPELVWLVENLRSATDRYYRSESQDDLQSLLSWRRLAFRLFFAEIEALIRIYRDICWFKRQVGWPDILAYPDELDDALTWQHLRIERRYRIVMTGLGGAFAMHRDETKIGPLEGWMADARAVRRRLAHPKALPDLVPEERAVEQLRRVMIGVAADLVAALDAVIPEDQRPWRNLIFNTGPFKSLKQYPLRRLGDGWETGVHECVAAHRSKTHNLVFYTLKTLGDDSIWAMQEAAAAVRSAEWNGGERRRSDILARVLGTTFFGEIEGTCAVLSRAALYAHMREEIAFSDAEVEWLECACGMKPMHVTKMLMQGELELENQIKRSLELYGRAYGNNGSADFDGENWASVVGAISLRNRIYHPAGLQDLRVELDEYDQLLRAAKWFREARDALTIDAK